ncbi:YncE family protein [Roseateles sp. GG27B]
MKNFNKLLLSVALAGLFNLPAFAADVGSYEVVQRLPLGPATKWDFVSIDAQHQRLFVTRGDRVDVVSLPAGNIVGTIANTPGVHGVAIAPELKLGFTSNGKSNSVTVLTSIRLRPKQKSCSKGRTPTSFCTSR